ncbi:hypothetical protein Tco_0726659 [Tanacetum coccineum]|uniref:Uncharacterized protein n=1 Tax=Tanacetum coccineum TaxID=301880 RepID=A0ABQ4YHV7_9ASTR
MDNPNITMEEYIRLEEEKAHRRGRTFNWETATYGKVSYFDDFDYFKDFENDFTAIVYNDALTSGPEISSEPTIRYEGKEYTDTYSVDFEERLERIYDRRVHRVHVFDLGGLTEEMDLGVSARIRMEHNDDQGQVVFTSLTWRRLFKIRGPLVRELMLEFFSTFRIVEGIFDLDATELDSDGFVVYWAEIPKERPFDEVVPQADRVQHCWEEQTPEKVTSTDLFYLRSMDVRAQMSRGHFIACLADHFGLFTKDRLQGLTMVVRDLQMIDMDELVRFWIYDRLGDTWVWVAPGSERQHEATTRVAQVIEFVCCELILDFLDHFHLFANVSANVMGGSMGTLTIHRRHGLWLKLEDIKRIMPPLRRLGASRTRGSRRAAMERMIADRVAQAIEDHEKKRASSSNTEGSSSSASTFAGSCPLCGMGNQYFGSRNWNKISMTEFRKMMTTSTAQTRVRMVVMVDHKESVNVGDVMVARDIPHEQMSKGWDVQITELEAWLRKRLDDIRCCAFVNSEVFSGDVSGLPTFREFAWGAPVLFVKKKDGAIQIVWLVLFQDRSAIRLSPVTSS